MIVPNRRTMVRSVKINFVICTFPAEINVVLALFESVVYVDIRSMLLCFNADSAGIGLSAKVPLSNPASLVSGAPS